MNLFLLLASKLLPLTIFVLFGFIAGRKLDVKKESVAKILIFMVTPSVVFTTLLQARLDLSLIGLPFFFFGISVLLCFLFLKMAGRFQPSPAKNIIAFSAGNCNSGYFGLPAAIALFGDQAVIYSVMISFGFILYENTVGYYVTARGNYDPRESWRRVKRLPVIYAFVVGLFLNLSGLTFPNALQDFSHWVRGTYSVLGMMLIGMGVSALPRFQINWKFTSPMLLAKFLFWPLLMTVTIALDQNLFHLFTPMIHRIILLVSVLPMAANTVAFATELKAEPEKASAAVLVSTIISLFLIPILFSFFLAVPQAANGF